MILVFEGEDTEEDEITELDLDDMTNAIAEGNNMHFVKLMIHQKVSQPSVICELRFIFFMNLLKREELSV